MRRILHTLPVLIILLVGLWGVAGLWKVPGLPTSHDSISHITRMYAYLEGMKDGIFPVLWARRMFWGIGSPVLMLNYQIPYYFSMMWHAVGLNLDDSFKAVLTFSQIASGLLMYSALKNRYRTIPSLVGAILYMVSPYRFLNIYVRGAMGEVFSTMFPPLILAGIWRQSIALQTIGWAGLFLSHPVGSALYSGLFLGYSLIEANFRKILVILKKFFLPYLLAFMIAAFNLLPTLALTKYTYYTPADSDTLHQFPTFHQLVYTNWGFGFSTDNDRDEMSFQIGVIQWFLLFAAITSIALIKKDKAAKIELAYCAFVFVIAVMLMLKTTATPIYIHLGLRRIIDFPWRILMIFSFLAALLSSQIISQVKVNWLKYGLAMFLIAGAIYTNRNHIRINQTWPWPSDSFQHGTGDAFGEYAAKYRSTREGSLFYEIAEFVKGSGQIEIVKNISNETETVVRTKEASIVRFNMMYFPGWVVRIDGDIVPIDDKQNKNSLMNRCYTTVRAEKSIDDSGLIACQILPGVSRVSLKYEALPVQRIGNLISFSGIGILLWYMYRSFSLPTTKPKRS